MTKDPKVPCSSSHQVIYSPQSSSPSSDLCLLLNSEPPKDKNGDLPSLELLFSAQFKFYPQSRNHKVQSQQVTCPQGLQPIQLQMY